MPRYLWKVQYTTEGARGVLAEGGSARRAAIVAMVESVGGTIESCDFALGTHQLYVIGSVPDEMAAATLALRTAASGYARSESIELLTPEQIDEAVRRDTEYRAPGQ
ncbi:GYD domain-containing protein [Mycolicibacterium llatzerense]|uniref:GYD domain protein n=1 Tax=Mycolicibacterium llatzerense TaxID=280871 RepID=A0A0D1JRZ1_9MYCO|nr:GYD domain-containing protein [Mycolicibacterium llatzerense]KIU15354.1 GYD domain protein [Mycolicibacterium llatzerense]